MATRLARRVWCTGNSTALAAGHPLPATAFVAVLAVFLGCSAVLLSRLPGRANFPVCSRPARW